jgi:hypothetical protein
MFTFLQWLERLSTGQELALWVAVSITLYVVSAQLAWRTRDLTDTFLGENIRWLDSWRFRHLAWQLIRFLYYVVIPYGLLVSSRLLSSRALGLVGGQPHGLMGWSVGEWLRGVGWSLACGLAGVILVGGTWWALARRLDDGSVFYLHHRPPPFDLLWDAVFLQVHWAFYRAAAGAWLLDADPFWGVLLGLVLLGLEAFGDPSLHFDRQWPSLASGWVRLGAVAWLTALSFFLTRNLWLAFVLHWGLTWALTVLGGQLSRWSLSVSADRG